MAILKWMVTMRSKLMLILLFLIIQLAACSPTNNCPATIPNGSTPPGESASQFYHGNGQLWTALWPGGRVEFTPNGPGEIRSDGSLAMKFPWWRAEGLEGPIEVSGERLDRPGSGVSAEMPDGYGDTGFQPSALVFPSEGCWEVSARVGAAELSFVVEVLLNK